MWTTIAGRARSACRGLEDLSEVEWEARSNGEGWTVEDVLAHTTSSASLTPPTFLLNFAASGFSFPKFADKGIARQKGGTPAETLRTSVQGSTPRSHLPDPKTTWLGETIAHADYIRRPLGIRHAYPTDAKVLDSTRTPTPSSAPRPIAGLTLKATDTDWTDGSGPRPGTDPRPPDRVDRRSAALNDLSGDGVETLRERVRHGDFDPFSCFGILLSAGTLWLFSDLRCFGGIGMGGKQRAFYLVQEPHRCSRGPSWKCNACEPSSLDPGTTSFFTISVHVRRACVS